jgi:hypothetical protein
MFGVIVNNLSRFQNNSTFLTIINYNNYNVFSIFFVARYLENIFFRKEMVENIRKKLCAFDQTLNDSSLNKQPYYY